MTLRELITELVRMGDLDTKVVTSTALSIREIESVGRVMIQNGSDEITLCMSLGAGKEVEWEHISPSDMVDRSMKELTDMLDKKDES